MSSTFRPYSSTHLTVLLIFICCITALVMARRRFATAASHLALDRALGFFALAAAIFTNAWPLLPRHFELAWSLPLHVCDLAMMLAPLVLLKNHRLPRALLYFWGIGLSSQGFFTPDLLDGPARPGFWVFWLTHYVVVGIPLYDVIGRGFRPTWRDYAAVGVANFAYLIVVLPLDVAFGMNYGYVGNAPSGQASLLDALGPWPLRVAWIVLLTFAVMALLMAPWEVARRLGAKRQPATIERLAPGRRAP